MVKLTITKLLQAQLDRLDEEAQICDETGRTLGYYLPESLRRQRLYERARSQVTDEELDLARQDPGGSSLAEIWMRLGRA